MGIYKNIRRECDRRRISVLGLETELGLSRSSICKWDKNTPSVDKVAAVASRLGVPIEALLQEQQDDKGE